MNGFKPLALCTPPRLYSCLASCLALTLMASIECAWGSPATPSIGGESAMKVIAPDAALSAIINPNSLDTHCVFQYLTDADFVSAGYGNATSVPCSPSDVGSDSKRHGVTANLTGLTPGTTYHFRAVATNAAGTTDGADMTFQETFKAEAVASVALLPNPNNFSLALDAADYVYVGDAASGSVVRIAPRGDQAAPLKDAQGNELPPNAPCVTVILSGPTVEGQPSPTPCLPGTSGFPFAGPKGIAISSDGTVYVTGTGGSTNQCDSVVGIFPDGEVVELVNRKGLGPQPQGLPDWNPAGIAVDEGSAGGVFVYATGPAGNGATVRINPDRTFQEILTTGGQGLVVDADTGNVYVALPGPGVMEIPDARSGVCNVDGKMCPVFIKGTPTTTTLSATTTTTVPGITTTTTTMPSPGASAAASASTGNVPPCDGRPITLAGAYGLALAGGILYVTGQDSNNVLRVPLRADNALGLRLCVEEIFSDGIGGLALQQPRAIAADSSGNVYVAGAVSNNVIWIRPAAADKTQTIPQEIINNAGSGLNKPEAVAVDSQGNANVSGNLDGGGTPSVFRVKTVTADLNPSCGNMSLDEGEACDYSLDCCCSLNCTIQSAKAVCRGSSGICDVNDVCDGISPICTDQFKAAGIQCHVPNEICDRANYCTGTEATCPNTVQPSGTPCRPAVNNCDLPEVCDGSSPTCPPDSHLPQGSACVPPSPHDSLCSSATCDVNSMCVATPLPDGGQCGGFCANSSCRQGTCTLNAGQHPCGPAGSSSSNADLCDPKNLGHECTHCGDGIVDPWEECDAGAALKTGPTDGCTQHCLRTCDQSDPSRQCAQPSLGSVPGPPNTPEGPPTEEEVSDPCRPAICTPLSPASLGSACEIPAPSCTGCLQSDQECQDPTLPDPCLVCDAKNHKCGGQSGQKYYTCAFAPLKTDMCQDVTAGKGTRRLLKVAMKDIEQRRKLGLTLATMAMDRCSIHAKDSKALLRRAEGELEKSVVEIVVLGFGRASLSQCVDQVSGQLAQRASRIRNHLTLTAVQHECGSKPGVPAP